MTVIAVSGHRPEKIPDQEYCRGQIQKAFKSLQSSYIYVGMASGIDLLAGDVAIDLGIPYTAAKPWFGHKARKDDVALYNKVIHNAADIVAVSNTMSFPGKWIYGKRNEYMVDHAEMLLAVWDGTDGGTCNCIKYAMAQKQPIFRIDPLSQKAGWFRRVY